MENERHRIPPKSHTTPCDKVGRESLYKEVERSYQTREPNERPEGTKNSMPLPSHRNVEGLGGGANAHLLLYCVCQTTNYGKYGKHRPVVVLMPDGRYTVKAKDLRLGLNEHGSARLTGETPCCGSRFDIRTVFSIPEEFRGLFTSQQGHRKPYRGQAELPMRGEWQRVDCALVWLLRLVADGNMGRGVQCDQWGRVQIGCLRGKEGILTGRVGEPPLMFPALERLEAHAAAWVA